MLEYASRSESLPPICNGHAAHGPGDQLRPINQRNNAPACQHRTVGPESLAGDGQAEVIEPAELGQVRAGKGSVRQVEVCQSGRPRLPSRGSDAQTQPEARSRMTFAAC